MYDCNSILLKNLERAHICNPSYSGVRDQEDHGSKPAWAIVCEILSRKTLSQRIGLVEWLKVKALSLSPSTEKKKNKKKLRTVV
jgi:hypothetical protein